MIELKSSRPQDLSAALDFSFLSLPYLPDSLSKRFNGSLYTILDGNVDHKLLLTKRLEFLFPLLVTSRKSPNSSKTSNGVPG